MDILLAEKKIIDSLLYIFCKDAFLLELNRKHLKHDTLTDVLTFPESYKPIRAEIYISLDRVHENSITHGNGSKIAELGRVILHGLLHMCLYDDKTESDQQSMRQKESFYLRSLPL